MGMMELFLFAFVGHVFVCVHSLTDAPDVPLSQVLPRFFTDVFSRPLESNFDFAPYDTIFSAWRTGPPDFHMLAELPPTMKVPRVHVYCDESQLMLLVDKQFDGIALTGEEVQLGDGCYSNREQPNQLVFVYSFDQCGTSHTNSLEEFSNYLHFHLRKPPSDWWNTPSTMRISCMPKRSPAAHRESGRSFQIKAMNPSWTNRGSDTYKRGQAVNLQVSATLGPGQQLFIQSCFVSASAEPHTRPRHTVIMNKGCSAPLGSSHALVQFVDSKSTDVIRFTLNTTYLISELYVHCSVVVSDQRLTSGSKSCNYNLIQSRWEELGGNVHVCSCCSTKCKGLSMKQLPEDAKAIVSTGPLLIVNKQVEVAGLETSSVSDSVAAEDVIISISSEVPDMQWSSPPKGVMVLSQDPVSRLTLWLPGQVKDTGLSGLPELSDLNTENEIRSEAPLWDVTVPADGVRIRPPQNTVSSAQKSQTNRFRRPEAVGSDAAQPFSSPPPPGSATDENPDRLTPMRDEPVMTHEERNDARPVIRSKLQLSKSADGSQTLSYEEEAVKQEEGRQRGDGQTGVLPTFLQLIRWMEKI